jgi:hypothetical protein
MTSPPAKCPGGSASRDGNHREQLRLADEIENCFTEFDAGLARCKKEPDMGKRRELEGKLKVGPLIGEMERLLKTANADNDVAMCLLHDEIMRQSIGQFLSMMDWQIIPDENVV